MDRLGRGATERRVDLVRVARKGRHRAGRQQVIAVMQLQVEPLAERPLRLPPPRFVMAQRMDGLGTSRLGDLAQLLHRIAAPQDQPRMVPCQIALQRLQRMMQEPARGAAHLALSGSIIIEHIDRDHRPLLCCRPKGGLIDQAQVPAQPDDLWRCHCYGTLPHATWFHL